MQTTTLGNGGPEVGIIGLGCMGMTASYDLETARDDTTSIAVIHRALELGMTLIDTADAYGPYTNEELVGRALAGDYRERAVLATKVGLVMGASDDTKAAGLRRRVLDATDAPSMCGNRLMGASDGWGPITWTSISSTESILQCLWRKPGPRWQRQ